MENCIDVQYGFTNPAVSMLPDTRNESIEIYCCVRRQNLKLVLTSNLQLIDILSLDRGETHNVGLYNTKYN